MADSVFAGYRRDSDKLLQMCLMRDFSVSTRIVGEAETSILEGWKHAPNYFLNVTVTPHAHFIPCSPSRLLSHISLVPLVTSTPRSRGSCKTTRRPSLK